MLPYTIHGTPVASGHWEFTDRHGLSGNLQPGRACSMEAPPKNSMYFDIASAAGWPLSARLPLCFKRHVGAVKYHASDCECLRMHRLRIDCAASRAHEPHGQCGVNLKGEPVT